MTRIPNNRARSSAIIPQRTLSSAGAIFRRDITSEPTLTTKAKLFMSGRSQAIRLPAKLRVGASEVVIEQIGQALWVKPREEAAENMGVWLEAFYKRVEALPEDFLADRQDPPAQQRDWT